MAPRFGGPLARINWDAPPSSPEDLLPLRQEGDPLGDAFTRALNNGQHADLISYCSSKFDAPSPPNGGDRRHLSKAFLVLRYLSENPSQDPPTPSNSPPASAELRQAARALWDSASVLPPWLDPGKLRRGQDVFLENAGASFLVLLYGSLMGGLSAPWIVPVLQATGYLTGPDPSAAMRRLFETTSFVVDCVLDTDMPLHGTAWSSCLSVRLLHSQVRTRLMDKPVWKEGDPAWGLPINQEDQAVTLLSFSYVVAEGLKTLGLGLTRADTEAYLHLWRYVGFLLGVEDHANFCGSEEQAFDALSSLLSHLLRPDESSAKVAASLLAAMTKLPLHWSPARHAELSRLILGHDLCDALKLPRGRSWVDSLVVRGVVATLQVHRLVGWIVPGAKGFFRQRSKEFCETLVLKALKGPAGFELRTQPVVAEAPASATLT